MIEFIDVSKPSVMYHHLFPLVILHRPHTGFANFFHLIKDGVFLGIQPFKNHGFFEQVMVGIQSSQFILKRLESWPSFDNCLMPSKVLSIPNHHLWSLC